MRYGGAPVLGTMAPRHKEVGQDDPKEGLP